MQDSRPQCPFSALLGGGGGNNGNGIDLFSTLLNVLGGGQGGFPNGGPGGFGGFGAGGGFPGGAGGPNNFNGNTNDVDTGLAQYGRYRNRNNQRGRYRNGK